MEFSDETLEWYYTLKAMNDAITNKQHHALFVLTNYQNIRKNEYKWKEGTKPQDKAVLLRVINADVISQVIKGIESLFSIAYVGLLAKRKGVDYEKMKKWYFFYKVKDLNKEMRIFEGDVSTEDWNWILWISDFEEAKSSGIFNDTELSYIKKLYDNYIARAQSVFKYALEFWKLLKPVRNAFSHTLRFIPNPSILHNMPKGYDDILLVLDCDWETGNPIMMPVITGYNVLRVLTALFDLLTQFEKSIIRNHTFSIRSEGKKHLPIITMKNPELGSPFYLSISRKFRKLNEIDVTWEDSSLVEKVKPQFELYKDFWKKSQELGSNFNFPEEPP